MTGNTEVEDSLDKLDKLTQEEARMASAELLKMTHVVEGKVQDVRGDVQDVGDRVQSIDGNINRVTNRVQGVDEKLEQVNSSLFL